VQHELATAAGITFFSQQRAFTPWMPGLTNVQARHSLFALQSLWQLCALP
jgi:hypothetical protein